MKRLACTMKFLQISIVFAIVLPAASGQNGQSPSPAMQEAIEHWRHATVALGQVVLDGKTQKFVTTGTGVIIGTDQRHICILTAKHVVYQPEKGYIPTQIYVRLPQQGSAAPDLGIKLDLTVRGQNVWMSLPDGSDLAIVPIALSDFGKYLQMDAVSLADFGQSGDIFQGASVVILGYPEILGSAYQTTPIAREGIVAWTDPEGRLERPFLVDANLWNGNSGGPVFHPRIGMAANGTLNLGNFGYALIGIISKDAYEDANVHVGPNFIGQVDPKTGKSTPLAAQVLNIGGIGIVEPVSKARLLVEGYFNTLNTPAH